MSETWVVVTTDPSKMIDFAALAIHEGWVRSFYRVPDEERNALRADYRSQKAEVYDQDA